MRNLGEYPVTDAEIIGCLTELRAQLVAGARGVGDSRPTLIDAAIERIADHPRAPARIGVNIPFAQYGGGQTRAPAGRFARLMARIGVR